jgi:uncharacterized protein (DUF1499 family)
LSLLAGATLLQPGVPLRPPFEGDVKLRHISIPVDPQAVDEEQLGHGDDQDGGRRCEPAENAQVPAHPKQNECDRRKYDDTEPQQNATTEHTHHSSIALRYATVEIVFCVLVFALAVLALLSMVRAVLGHRPRLLAICFLILAAVELGIWFLAPQFPRRIATALRTNVAETSTNPEFPELRTRVYKAPPERVLEAIKAAIASRPGTWELVSSDTSGHVHATKKVLVFTDDVYIFLQTQPAGTRVDARSQSRVGKGDFGENRRHIATLLSDVDWYLR